MGGTGRPRLEDVTGTGNLNGVRADAARALGRNVVVSDNLGNRTVVRKYLLTGLTLTNNGSGATAAPGFVAPGPDRFAELHVDRQRPAGRYRHRHADATGLHPEHSRPTEKSMLGLTWRRTTVGPGDHQRPEKSELSVRRYSSRPAAGTLRRLA